MSASPKHAPLLECARRDVLQMLTGVTLALSGCGSGSNATTGSPVPIETSPSPTPTPTPTPTSTGSPNIIVTGMSIFQGADLVPPNYPDRSSFTADHTPVRYFHRALLQQPEFLGRAIEYDNRSVPGSFDNDVPAQFLQSTQEPKGLYFLGLAMNSGSTYGVYSRGPNAGYTYSVLQDHIRRVKSAGLTPFVCNTIHPWPNRVSVPDMVSALYDGLNWPADRRTLYDYSTYEFDTASNTITRPGIYADNVALFDHKLSGGALIKAGSKLRVALGPNDGRVMTVVERVDGTTLRVKPGDIAESGMVQSILQHVAPPLDEIMETPPSRQLQNKDWTGNGTAVDGLASYSLWNNMLADLCRQEEIKLLDIEYRGFRWVERQGWASVYTATYEGVTISNINHPVYAAQSVIYGELMTWLAEQYAEKRLSPGFAILRGPEIH